MNIDKKFKSTLVVWYGQELPVIEIYQHLEIMGKYKK